MAHHMAALLVTAGQRTQWHCRFAVDIDMCMISVKSGASFWLPASRHSSGGWLERLFASRAQRRLGKDSDI
jgi:hypothetical protein